MTVHRIGGPRPIVDDGPIPPEELLARRSRQADLDRLYRERAPQLLEHFSARSRDAEGAAEVVQEAFARFAALADPRRRSIIRPDAYLFRICLNIFRDRGRAHSSSNIIVAELDNGLAHDGVAELEARDTLRRLENAMLRLKPKTREIFLARRLDGMSYAQIAERTGLSVKGVEKHMTKAIAKIARMMHQG